MFSVIKKEKKFLIFLFFISFIIRALFFYLFLSKDENYLVADSQPYHCLAERIASGNGITNLDGTPQFFRLPGFPLFLATGYKLFDFDIEKALWLQVILACFIPILVFCLSLILFPSYVLLAKISSIV